MLVYHCKLVVASDMIEIMSFNVINMAWLLISGWLSADTLCRPGALI